MLSGTSCVSQVDRSPGLPAGSSLASAQPTGVPPGDLLIAHVAGRPALTVELARTDAERARGLMDRQRLASRRGMLFVFPETTTTGFFMYRTLVPLSIAWVDRGRIVAVAEMTPCRESDPADCPTYHPGQPYTSAIEAPENFFTTGGSAVGAAVRITPLAGGFGLTVDASSYAE
ncbi:hypothetical protein BH24ACT13_BH24ACT13_00230 [soil metagenome]